MTIHAEESVPAPVWDEGTPSTSPPVPRREPQRRALLKEPNYGVDPGEPTRPLGERFLDALPLAAASIACGVVGWIVRGQESATSSREFPIWGLFVALAIIAGMGALVSFMIDEEEAPVSRTRARGRPLRSAERAELGEPSTVDDPLDDLDALDSAAEFPLRGGGRDPDTALPGRRPAARPPDPTIGLGVDLEGLESPGAAEAIAEIDILWSDLERMRRQRSRGPRAGSA